MGRETSMRAELAAATAGLLTHLPGVPHDTEPVAKGLIALAALVSQARSPVHRGWGGEVELVGDAEAPTRIIKQLGQLWRACGVLGLGRPESWKVVERCALDSIPKLRGAVIRYLTDQDEPTDTTTIRIALAHPKRTVLRALEDLTAHHVITRISAGQGHADQWTLSDRARSWTTSTQGVPKMLESLRAGDCTIHSERGEEAGPTDVAGGQVQLYSYSCCDQGLASQDQAKEPVRAEADRSMRERDAVVPVAAGGSSEDDSAIPAADTPSQSDCGALSLTRDALSGEAIGASPMRWRSDGIPSIGDDPDGGRAA
jgi:hypothetical protein